ncbi:MAG: helix-hairpin-helix domain-containing protein [Acidimicrobiales bacterium]
MFTHRPVSRSRRHAATGLAALLLVAGAAACGGSDDADAVGGAGAAASTAAAAATAPADGAKLSANTASEDELMTIPGVGQNIAHEIVEYRPYDAATGPDRFRDEMRKYIDDAEIERIMQYLDFAG